MDEKTLIAYANQSGFLKDVVEKVWRLVDILAIFAQDEVLSQCLALRGGTQINLLTYDDLPRLSLDIDLDFCGELTREQTLQKREEINSRLKRYLTTNGYTLSDQSRYSHSLDGFRWRYRTFSGGPDALKIEVNYSMRVHALPLKMMPVNFPLSSQKLQILSMSPLEVMACKISALLRRCAARDLFDVDHFIRSGLFATPQEQKLMRQLVVFYQALESPVPISVQSVTSLDQIGLLAQNDYQRNLLPVMRHGQSERPFDVPAAQERVRGYLRSLLVLTANEQEFVTNFAACDYRPELLFDDPRTVSHIINHPMALWKCRPRPAQ